MRRKKRIRLNDDLVTVTDEDGGYASAVSAGDLDVPDDDTIPAAIGATGQSVDRAVTPVALADELVARAEQSRERAQTYGDNVRGLIYIGDAILALCERLAERE